MDYILFGPSGLHERTNLRGISSCGGSLGIGGVLGPGFHIDPCWSNVLGWMPKTYHRWVTWSYMPTTESLISIAFVGFISTLKEARHHLPPPLITTHSPSFTSPFNQGLKIPKKLGTKYFHILNCSQVSVLGTSWVSHIFSMWPCMPQSSHVMSINGQSSVSWSGLPQQEQCSGPSSKGSEPGAYPGQCMKIRWENHGFPFRPWSTHDGFSTSMLVYRGLIRGNWSLCLGHLEAYAGVLLSLDSSTLFGTCWWSFQGWAMAPYHTWLDPFWSLITKYSI